MEEEGIYYYFKHADGRTRWSWPTRRRAMPTCPGGDDDQLRADAGRAPPRRPHLRPGRRARIIRPASSRCGTTASSCPGKTSRRPSRFSHTVSVGTVSPQARASRQRRISRSTTIPASTPSASTASIPAAATGPPTWRRSSRTTSAPSTIRMQAGDDARAAAIEGEGNVPQSGRGRTSSRWPITSTPTATTS